MRSSRAAAVVISAFVICVVAVPALAGQLDPSTKPATKGPLAYDDQFSGPECTRQIQKTNGQVNAVTRLCAFFYKFDPNSETDATHDYGVWWVQSSITPKNGWCATSTSTDLDIDQASPFEPLKAAPDRETDVTATERVVAKLVVDDDGNATTNGVIKQHFLLYPDKLVPRLLKKAHVLKLKWYGASKHALSFAGGAEVEWTAGGDPPAVSPNLSASMAKGSSCD
jgi:hypothetical protein